MAKAIAARFVFVSYSICVTYTECCSVKRCEIVRQGVPNGQIIDPFPAGDVNNPAVREGAFGGGSLWR